MARIDARGNPERARGNCARTGSSSRYAKISSGENLKPGAGMISRSRLPNPMTSHHMTAAKKTRANSRLAGRGISLIVWFSLNDVRGNGGRDHDGQWGRSEYAGSERISALRADLSDADAAGNRAGPPVWRALHLQAWRNSV